MFSNKYRLTLEEFIKKANKCHNNFYDYSKVNYKNAKEKVCIICPEHGEFWQLPNNHLFGNGCPECKKSKLEKKMKNFLIENKIRFSEQKTFEWLIYKENMRLDFYLPDYNIAIECQGEQHFKPVNFGCETEEDMFEQFKNTQDRDKKKKELCNTNNIKLLYYSDKKYENNIFTDLKEILKYIELCLRE
jgi:very-short-patch-repair endonuclease